MDTMKRIIIIATAFVALYACSGKINDPGLSQTEDAIVFSARSSDTRTVVGTNMDRLLTVAWADEDAVGIYGFSDGQSVGNNVQYIAVPTSGDASKCTFRASDAETIFRWRNGMKQEYHAYYPWAHTDVADVKSHPFSLPSEQIQNGADSPNHLSRYGLMTASQRIAADEKNDGGIQFVFSNIFSVVEFRLKMDAATSISTVPITSARLISKSGDLAWKKATIDLSADMSGSLPVSVLSADREITLMIEGNVDLKKKEWHSIYFVVAPGSHTPGSLSLELTAIDNSIHTVMIDDAVTFLPNRHYVKEYELTLDAFIPGETFEAEIPSLECRAGEPFSIGLKGNATTVELWTGEVGHDYEYAEKDRMQEANMTVNFTMALNSGYQRSPAKIKYSNDMKGAASIESIEAATWTDVSDKFDFTTLIAAVDADVPKVDSNTVPHDAGIVDCTDWFGSDGNCRIAFFYHIDKYDDGYIDPIHNEKTGNGRTYFYLFDMWVRAKFASETNYTELYRQAYDTVKPKPEYPVFVQGDTFGSSDGKNPINVYSYVNGAYTIRLGSAFKPTADRDSYLVLPLLTRPETKNVGPDKPVKIKLEGEDMPLSYSYVFNKPGTYNVTLVGVVRTLAGDKKIIKSASITVME